MKISKITLILVLGMVLEAPWSRATETEFWKIGTFKGFLAGQLQGVSASMDGQLLLAPEMRAVFNPDETVALSVVADHRGNLYIGTGHQGKVFKLDSQFHGKLLFQAPEPEILALAVGPDHNLYVGTSPEGEIYRVTPDGRSSAFYSPHVKYIWALAFDSQGQLYAGTGDRGEILKINRSGQGGVFFTSNQTHIMCLAFDPNGNLLAGSEPGGLIYRLTPQGKAFVLYQANLPEIHALATDAQGRIYAAALGNMMNSGEPAGFPAGSGGAVVSAPAATVTVTASGDEVADPPQQVPRRAPRRSRTPSLSPTESAGVGAPFRGMSLGRGELIQILPNYSAQTLWSSDKASIFGLATRGDDVLFSTDTDGHIFDLRPAADGPQLTLVTETRESLPTRLLADGSNLFVATSNIAKLIRVGTGLGSEGIYESPVKDARFVSHWGQLAWRAETPSGCELTFYARSGNSAQPDNTWSDWTGPYSDAQGSQIVSTPARYIQWKAVFHGSNGSSPMLRAVTLSYLNQNLAPEIHSLTIANGSERMTLTGTPMSSPGSVEMMSTMGTVAAPIMSSSVYESPSSSEAYGYGKSPITISWQASDPNQDHLIYDLYLKSAQQQEWHLLRGKLQGDTFNLQPDTLPDGEYQVRLVASDAPSNPPDQALQADLISAPFWVDNTPPEIRVIHKEVDGENAFIHFEANTQVSPLQRAEVSVGENNWHPILSDDGIVDTRHETFTVKLNHLSPGEHVVSLRVTDVAGNIGVGAAVIQVR